MEIVTVCPSSLGPFYIISYFINWDFLDIQHSIKIYWILLIRCFPVNPVCLTLSPSPCCCCIPCTHWSTYTWLMKKLWPLVISYFLRSAGSSLMQTLILRLDTIYNTNVHLVSQQAWKLRGPELIGHSPMSFNALVSDHKTRFNQFFIEEFLAEIRPNSQYLVKKNH